MSMEHYERIPARVDLFEKLAVAQAQSASDDKGFTTRRCIEEASAASAWPVGFPRYLPIAVDDLTAIFRLDCLG